MVAVSALSTFLVFASLVPSVALIERDAISFADRAELVLKRPLTMMFALIRDVASEIIELRLADREYAVSILPGEVRVASAFCFDPF